MIVPKTGQTACYDSDGNPRNCIGTGEDGEFQNGYDRFTDNGDGTITDNFTKLMWLKDTNCIATNYPSFDNDSVAGNGEVTWQHALDFVTGINDGTYPLCGAGYTDWRLPNVSEALSLPGAIPLEYYFANTLSDTGSPNYWTSSTHPIKTDESFVVEFSVPHKAPAPKNMALFYVFPVRDTH